MKFRFTLLAILLTAGAATRAQVVPATKGHAGLPPVSGVLHYDLRYAQTAQFGGGVGNQQRSFVSGDASYANTDKRLPFSMQYGGGIGWVWTGPASAGNVFQHLSLSQGYVKHSWNLSASENVSYTFETPTTGFTGVPGTGSPIGGTGSTTLPNQSILALNTRALDNNTTLGFGHKLDHATSLNIGGAWGQMRFIDGNGQNTDTKSANAGISRRLNARNSLSGQYTFSRYDYGGMGLTMQSNSGQLSLSRKWNRRFNTSVAAGPVWITSSGLAGMGAKATPNSTMLSLNASANYSLRRQGSASVSYSRGTTGGSGYMLGAKEDSLNGNYSREFGKKLTVGLTASYMRSSSLAAAQFVAVCPIGSTNCICPIGDSVCLLSLNFMPVTDSIFGGVQATRRLGKNFNLFANYTAIDQSSSLTSSVQNTSLNSNTNILNGMEQMISFGIGYSPKEKRFKQ